MGAHKHLDFTCLGHSLGNMGQFWLVQLGSKHITDPEKSCATQPLTAAEGGYPSENAYFDPFSLPMSTLLFEQPPRDAATPLIHAEEAGWRKKRHALQARLN